MDRKNEKVPVHQQQPVRVRVLAIVGLVMMVVAGVLVAHFVVPSPYFAAQNRAIGSDVSVSGSMVPNSIKAVGTRASRTPFADTQPLGPVTQITPSGKLPSPITLRFKLSRQVTTGEVALLATSEAPGGPWTLLQPIISSDGWVASVQANHLSWWQPLWLDLKAAVSDFKTEVLDGLSGGMTTTAGKPHCNNESQARQDNYTITSSAKDTLYWCFGIEDGMRILKVMNRMRYPLEVSHSGFTVKHLAAPMLDLDQLARLGSGQMTILYPFEEADYTINLSPGGKAVINTEYSGYAQGLYQLEFGVTALVQVLTRFGAGSGLISNGEIIKTGFTRIAEYMDKFLSIKDCSNVFRELSAGNLISGCFSPNDIIEVFGWKGLLLAPLMTIGPLVEFFHSELNALGDQFNDRDKYQILVHRFDAQAAFAPFVGTWHVHDANLTINADRTGSAWWEIGPCTLSRTETRMCRANTSITFTVNSDGSIGGKIQAVWYTQWGGEPYAGTPAGGGDLQPGDTFELQHDGAHLLYTMWLGSLSYLNNNGSNPYWCDSYASNASWYQCGA